MEDVKRSGGRERGDLTGKKEGNERNYEKKKENGEGGRESKYM